MKKSNDILMRNNSNGNNKVKTRKNKNVCAPFVLKGNTQTGMARCLNSKGKRTKKCKNKKITMIRSISNKSCLTKDALIRLLKAWNKSYPNNKIKLTKTLLKKDTQKLYDLLKQKMSSYCTGNDKDDELCWISEPFKDKQFDKTKLHNLKKLYRPEAPQEWKNKPNAWLSTIDIEKVLKQYEVKYPEFISYGALPIDFDLKDKFNGCMISEICQIKLKDIIRKMKKKYIGVVFNLDPHTKGGSHWISMFCNVPKKEINYWDSYGYKPPKEVTVLMNKLKDQGEEINLKMKIQINKKRHQYKDNACGVYSSHFIIQQLEGKSFKDVVNNIIKDDTMNDKRAEYFSL